MMLRLETIVCPLCKSPRFSHVASRFDRLDIVRCRKCKLAYINPRPIPEEILKMYEENYYDGGEDKGVGYMGYSASAGCIKYCPPFAWELLLEETLPTGLRTLDIGCAFGQWVYWMAKAGAKAMGIDVASLGVNWGREKLGLDLRQTTLESLDEPEESFDVITMIDLMEHIVDLDSFMTRLACLLKQGGSVFVQTPNFGSYSTWGDRCRYLRFSLEHLLYFECASLDNLFAKYGMFPTRKTRVLSCVPCDAKGYLEERKASRSRFKSCIRGLPGFDFVRLIRLKLGRLKHIYEYDETEQEGALIIGSFRKEVV